MTYETILITLKLTEEVRNLLNSQEAIKLEAEHNVTLMSYPVYEKEYLWKTNITTKLLNLLWAQYPTLYKIKDKLVISTFRTAIVTNSGLNGEPNYHIDNILFADNKDRNLILSWKIGTEALTLKDSKHFKQSRDKFIEMAFLEDYDDEFIDNHTFEHKCSEFIEKHGIVPIKSQAPNHDNDMSCLVMSGKEVFHKREDVGIELLDQYWRYVLNIYFSSDDIDL